MDSEERKDAPRDPVSAEWEAEADRKEAKDALAERAASHQRIEEYESELTRCNEACEEFKQERDDAIEVLVELVLWMDDQEEGVMPTTSRYHAAVRAARAFLKAKSGTYALAQHPDEAKGSDGQG